MQSSLRLENINILLQTFDRYEETIDLQNDASATRGSLPQPEQ
jgi:hypothetical protein